MIRKIFTLLLLLISINSLAQEDAWVYLTDKVNVQDALNNPITILTQKAIDRKLQHNIPIDESDVPVNEAYITQLKQQTGITVLAKSKWFNAVHVRGTETDINALSSLSFVDSIDFADKSLNSMSRSASQQDKFEIEETLVTFNYGSTQNQVEMISADDLHLDDFTGEGITIAVMDSGFPNVNTMGAFQRLRDNNDLLDGYDFVDRTSNVYAFTGSSHGTRVLSDMAAFIQDQFVGTAPDASYYLFRTEDVASENPVEESYWVEAAERADSLGVDMINTSLGYRVYDNPSYDYTPADMDGQTAFITRGASRAVQKGILVVTSAGNAGAIDWQTVGAPADSPDVLSVGAVDENGNYASFSSIGSAAQPTQKPDVVARGQSAFVVSELNTVTQNNGTSFSSPILCGGIASLWQALPDASPTQMMQFVRESASQFNAPDNFLGHGIPNLALARSIGLSVLENQITEFGVFPNPASDQIEIVLPGGIDTTQITIYNQLGQRVLKASLTRNNTQVNLSNMASGIYLLRVESQVRSKTFKLIKS